MSNQRIKNKFSSIKLTPEIELVDKSSTSIRYLEHGWPEKLCRWHAHQEYELHFIKSSSGTIYVGDFIGKFKKGNLYLIGPWLPHNWITENSKKTIELRDRLIQFNHESLVKWIEIYPEAQCLNQILEEAKVGIEFIDFPSDLAENYLISIRDKDNLEKLLKFYDFMLILSKWENRKPLSLDSQSTEFCSIKHKRVNNVVQYVVNNFQYSINLQDVADIAQMNKSAFSRYFHKATGIKFSDFLIQIRIGRAAAMLIESNDNVSTICYNVGFNNLANFNRHFIKFKTISPNQFRSKAKNALSKIQDSQSVSYG